MITALDKNTALVLIDLQKGVVKLPPADVVNNIVQNVVKLVDAFHIAGLPVIVVKVNPAYSKFSTSRKDAPPTNKAFFEGDSLDIIPEIKTEPGDIFITKHTWGAFYETPLDEELKKRNITGIVLAGISTSIGVEGTARQAGELGYNITFAKDAMTDSAPEAQDRSLKYIFPRLGEVGDTDQIIEKLS
jgi:nicotinamidase-related amidase